MKVAERVEKLAGPAIQALDLGLTLWDVEFVKEGGRQVLRVVIDHPGGVSIDHCQAVSQALDPLLDTHDPIPQSYVLQVSSAGLERVLKRESDFQRFLGEAVEVRLYAPREGRKEWQGPLQSYDGQTLTLSGGTRFDKKEIAQVKTLYKEE